MRKIVLIFGLIAGFIPSVMFFLAHPDGEIDMDNGMIIGYASMILAFSTIFFAVKRYRDNFGNGQIKFLKAFLIGLYISLIASAMYATSWEIYTGVNDINFAEQYQAYMETSINESGLSAEEAQAQIAESAEMMDMYANNLLFRFGMSITEILWVGVLFSLISALVFSIILKPKSEPETTA